MEEITMDSLKKDRSMDLVDSVGRMVDAMKEITLKMRNMALESLNGPTMFTKGGGRRVKCMGTASYSNMGGCI